MFITTHALTTPVAFGRNWNQDTQLFNTFNTDALNLYNNVGSAPTNPSLPPCPGYSQVPLQTWSEQGPSTSMALTDDFNNGYSNPNFQLNAQFQQPQFHMNNDPSLDFALQTRPTKAPSIIITILEDSQSMLNANQEAGFVLASGDFNMDPITSHGNTYQHSLDWSTLSSSGASESLTSPAEAPNLVGEKLGEGWDNQSLWLGLDNMQMVSLCNLIRLLRTSWLTRRYLQNTIDDTRRHE